MIKHTIRLKNLKYKEVQLTPQLAINYQCSECLGWEENPINCTSPYCSLYPFRPDHMWGIRNPPQGSTKPCTGLKKG